MNRNAKEIEGLNKETTRLQKRLIVCERNLYAHRQYREQDENPKTKKLKEAIAYMQAQLELANRKMEDDEKKIETTTALKFQRIDNKIQELKEDTITFRRRREEEIEAHTRKNEAEIAELETQRRMVESDKDIKLDRCDANPTVKYYMDEIKRRDDMLMEGVAKTKMEIQLEDEIAFLKSEIAKGKKRSVELKRKGDIDGWTCDFFKNSNPLFKNCEGSWITDYPRQEIKCKNYASMVVCNNCAPIAATKYYCRKCREYKYACQTSKYDDYECCQHVEPPRNEIVEPPRNEIVEPPPRVLKITKKKTISPPESINPPPDDYESVSTYDNDKFEKELEKAKQRAREENDRQEAEVDKKYKKAMEEYNTKRASLKEKETSLRTQEDKIYKESGYQYTEEYKKVKKQRQKVEDELSILRLPERTNYYPPMSYS